MCEKDVEEIFDELENYNKKKIDGMILACAMRLVHSAGLLLKEIPLLTIGNVFDQNSAVRNEIRNTRILKGEMILPIDIRVKLITYYNYLVSHAEYSIADTEPLFPGYYANTTTVNGETKKVERHLEDINPEYKHLIRDLHEQGISDYFKKSSYKKTSDQFRITETSVQFSINGNITAAGEAIPKGKYAQFLKTAGHCEKLLTLDYTDIKLIKEAIDDCYIDIYSSEDKGLKKTGEGSKTNAFKNFIKMLLNEWKP